MEGGALNGGRASDWRAEEGGREGGEIARVSPSILEVETWFVSPTVFRWFGNNLSFA